MTDYSRGDYADLPAGTTDLENNYTAPDLTAIASNDNSTYAEQTANNEIAIHQYKKTVMGQYTNITWSGKSSLAPSESPVIMEVYNVNGTVWEELDRDDSTAADTDFDIIYNNLATADYLDSGVITWRVWQAASSAPITKYIGEGTHGGIACDYSGCEDNWLRSGNPTINYGVSGIMQIYGDTSEVSLIKFSGLSNIPTGATVITASLWLYDHDGTGGELSITFRRLFRDWVAGTIDGADRTTDTPHSSCWDEYGNDNDWATAGGLSNGNDRSNTISYTSPLTTIPGAWHEFTSAQLIDDVQDMIALPDSNFGWHIDGTDAHTGNCIRFSTSQDGTAALRPYLVVTYTV